MSVMETQKELSVYESMAARFDVAARKLNLEEGLMRYLLPMGKENLTAGFPSTVHPM